MCLSTRLSDQGLAYPDDSLSLLRQMETQSSACQAQKRFKYTCKETESEGSDLGRDTNVFILAAAVFVYKPLS